MADADAEEDDTVEREPFVVVDGVVVLELDDELDELSVVDDDNELPSIVLLLIADDDKERLIVDEVLLRIDGVEEALEAGVEKDIPDSEVFERSSLPLEVVCTILPVLLRWLAVELSDGCQIIEEVPWVLTADDSVAWLSEQEEEEEEGEGDSDGEVSEA